MYVDHRFEKMGYILFNSKQLTIVVHFSSFTLCTIDMEPKDVHIWESKLMLAHEHKHV